MIEQEGLAFFIVASVDWERLFSQKVLADGFLSLKEFNWRYSFEVFELLFWNLLKIQS